MLKYWRRHSDWEAIEEVLVEKCNLSYGRWWYWSELHYALKSRKDSFSRGVGVRHDPEAARVFAAAAASARQRSRQVKPPITLPDLLYSIAQQDTELSRCLVGTGMDLRKISRIVMKIE
jgi:hypothetical protein